MVDNAMISNRIEKIANLLRELRGIICYEVTWRQCEFCGKWLIAELNEVYAYEKRENGKIREVIACRDCLISGEKSI